MPLAIGDKLGPYEILAALGAGGMGEVWKARDTRLGRIVAIKTLKGENNGRFLHEARAIAALNHPHICTLHDIGPDYLVMEYIEGTPVHGPVPAAEAVRIALQIAGALEVAHSKGILHRDLKPGNILVTAGGADSCAKLLDFGLAKIFSDEGADATTLAGGVSGTAAYMSPEQARGQALDARSDIFSFGAVLYEMLSGARAFSGASVLDTLNAVVRDQPAPLDSAAGELVRRCLAKDPSQRFQTVSELKAALEKIINAKAAESQPSIAVLPFANMSRDPDDEFFSDGLAEEILNILAHIPGLKVTARTSSFAFRGKEQDIRGIAEALNVRTIVEGSVRRAGSRIRVTAQLINAADGYHLWSERYDREMTDVFAVQDEIAAAIARELRVSLAGRASGPRRPRNLAAWEAFQEGQYFWLQFSPTSMQKSLACFHRALAAEPDYALAHVGIAEFYMGISIFTFANPAEALPKAREAARRALELEPELGRAHTLKAQVDLFLDYDWESSGRSFRRAIELNPEPDTYIRNPYALWYLIPNTRWREADVEFDATLQFDPLSFAARFGKAFALDCQGRSGEAEAVFRRGLEIDPANSLMLRQLALCVARQGRLDESFAIIERALHLHGRWPAALAAWAMVHAMAGQHAEADGILNELFEAQRHTYVSAERIAAIYALLGELDLAFDWAEKAVQQHDPPLLWIKQNFMFDALRSDPRYPKLLRKLNMG